MGRKLNVPATSSLAGFTPQCPFIRSRVSCSLCRRGGVAYVLFPDLCRLGQSLAADRQRIPAGREPDAQINAYGASKTRRTALRDSTAAVCRRGTGRRWRYGQGTHREPASHTDSQRSGQPMGKSGSPKGRKIYSLYQSCRNAKSRLREYANPVRELEEDSPRSISLKEPARTSTAIRKKRTVTPTPNVPAECARAVPAQCGCRSQPAARLSQKNAEGNLASRSCLCRRLALILASYETSSVLRQGSFTPSDHAHIGRTHCGREARSASELCPARGAPFAFNGAGLYPPCALRTSRSEGVAAAAMKRAMKTRDKKVNAKTTRN
jgi:hypothetical protein